MIRSIDDQFIPTADRRFGMVIPAARGSGKSRFLGRYLAFTDFLAGIPTIIIDNGDTIDNILDRIWRLPEELQALLWPRVRLIDLSGRSGRVFPFPLYYKLGNESALTIADRFVQMILKLDPELSTASVQGKTAIETSGLASGVALIEKGWQVSEVEHVDVKIEPTYQARLLRMQLDDTQRSIYCADKPCIDWREVIEEKQLVLISYQYIEHPEFILNWVLTYFLNFLQQQKTNGPPISLIFDELAAFQAAQSRDDAEFFKDLRNLINTIMRRYNLWLTVGLQDIGDFSDRTQNLLLTMGTKLIGATDNITSARKLAANVYRLDPLKVKRTRQQFQPLVRPSNAIAGAVYSDPGYYNSVEEPVEFTTDEQINQAAYVFMDKLPPFTFLGKFRNGRVSKVSYGHFEPDPQTAELIYPDEDMVANIRQWLIERDGRRIEDVLTEIAARTSNQPSVAPQPNATHQAAQQPKSATTKGPTTKRKGKL